MLLIPVITEKSMADAKQGKFTFKTPAAVRKFALRKAVEKAFGVNVTALSTTIVKGRSKRVGKKRQEKQIQPWKKAIVQVKSGQKIAIFDVANE